MNAIRAIVALSIVLSACSEVQTRDPTFVPPAQREELRMAWSASIPAMWSEVALSAEERNVLFVDLRLAVSLGPKDYDAACAVAVQTTSRHLPDSIPRRIRLIREWRVIGLC